MEKLKSLPLLFSDFVEQGIICEADIIKTDDGFHAVFKSMSDILATRGIVNFIDSEGRELLCDKFFDDWYLYAVPKTDTAGDCVYSLFKLREQEFDAQSGIIADNDTPGSTVSFIEFQTNILTDCLNSPTDENRKSLGREINRVVAYANQRHNDVLKQYFINPASSGAYVIARLYVKHIATFVESGYIDVPLAYAKMYKMSSLGKGKKKLCRIPDFIDSVNRAAGYTVCDHGKIYVADRNNLNQYESAVILATHTANVSVHSFAAEVEYHARFLIPLARFKIPFLGKSVYASAIRADMTIDDTEFEGPAPFHDLDSKIVKRQIQLHGMKNDFFE